MTSSNVMSQTANSFVRTYSLLVHFILRQNVHFCLACGQAIAANDNPQLSVLALCTENNFRKSFARTTKQLIRDYTAISLVVHIVELGTSGWYVIRSFLSSRVGGAGVRD